MKKILFLLLFVCSDGFGQDFNKFHKLFADADAAFSKSAPYYIIEADAGIVMTRTPQLNNTIIQYTPSVPARSVVIVLPGIGERGSDLSIIEKNIGVAKALKAGTFVIDRIILFAQLPSSQGGYYGNTLNPVIAYAQTFKLPIDISGLSLGGMGVSNNLPSYSGIRSAMTAPGKVEANVSAGATWPAIDYVAAYRQLPSIHYYDPADKTIDDGYRSTKALVTKLQGEGKKDISLIELPGKGHNVWDYAYLLENYWQWLNSLDSPVKIIADPIISTVFDGTNIIETTQSGKVITIKPTTID